MEKNAIFSRNRVIKTLILIFVDGLFITLSYWLGMWLRLDREIPVYSFNHWQVLLLLVPITILILLKIGFYRPIVKYINIKIIKIGIIGASLSTLLMVILSLFFHAFLPRTVPFIYFVSLIIFLCGVRLTYKLLLSFMHDKGQSVIIYGAGYAGRQLFPILVEGEKYIPIAFIDDNPKLHGLEVHGVRVYSPQKINVLVQKFNVAKILLAVPSASLNNRRLILNRLENVKCEVLTIPSFQDLVEGKAKISALKRVSIIDLLGRDPVEPIQELLSKNILNQNVMVTGGGGSIGSELCRQIIKQQPTVLILYDLTEYALYTIEKELLLLKQKYTYDIKIIPILGDVKDKAKLDKVISKYKIDTIYHAAAYKHVPLVEMNTLSGVQNNIIGTLHCALAAIDGHVKKFVLISTDKAVRPTNTMGATKRMSELVLQALSKEKHETSFSMVRFGNVLGSSGSVVPLFEKQISEESAITLTHQDITRFFMIIPEAAQLVIQAGAMGNGGDVFVLDMGEPVKIYDLAQKMIKLSGLTIKDDTNPDGDIAINIIGLRPGEKLYEELLIGDNVRETLHERIMVADEAYLQWDELQIVLDQINKACEEYNFVKVRENLINAQTGFTPSDEICDLLY